MLGNKWMFGGKISILFIKLKCSFNILCTAGDRISSPKSAHSYLALLTLSTDANVTERAGKFCLLSADAEQNPRRFQLALERGTCKPLLIADDTEAYSANRQCLRHRDVDYAGWEAHFFD